MSVTPYHAQPELNPAENDSGLHLPARTPTAEDALNSRIEHMPRDVGAMLLGVGFAGFVLPGIFGLPFLLAGGVILMPETTRKIKKKLGMEKSGHTDFADKQINRFLDDLDKRYPQNNTQEH
ncbi:MAG: hypothetical protein ACR2HF_02405 [Methylococcaceae bacterium]